MTILSNDLVVHLQQFTNFFMILFPLPSRQSHSFCDARLLQASAADSGLWECEVWAETGRVVSTDYHVKVRIEIEGGGHPKNPDRFIVGVDEIVRILFEIISKPFHI